MWKMDWSKLTDILAYNRDEPLIFSSGLFLFLFLGFSAVYVLLQRRTTARLLFVSVFSYYFYYKSSGLYFFLLGVVTLSDFLIAKKINVTADESKRKMLLVISLFVNLGMLCYFKYTNFFCEIVSSLWNGNFEPSDIFLPVGISFFTFQSLSYTIDVYRKNLEPTDNLLDYVFFVSFFPQLVAGPIVRARDFIVQIRKPLLVTEEMFGRGVFFIIGGLFKKAVISDYISVNFVERIFADPGLYSGLENLMGIYGYALQIYCDFSGYSDMAIGIALLLGFHFPLNFNSPYKSGSITDFWHRWHISLSTWLKDYLYISLGGNRKGKIRTYVNLLITMLLGGLWHGASWNFVVWGALHGAALAADKFFRNLLHLPKDYKSSGLKRFFAVIFTFHFVCLCWIFFRNSSFDASLTMLDRLFSDFHPSQAIQLFAGYWKVFLLMFTGYALHWIPDDFQEKCIRKMINTPLAVQAVILIALICLVVQIKGSDVHPFIYFQF